MNWVYRHEDRRYMGTFGGLVSGLWMTCQDRWAEINVRALNQGALNWSHSVLSLSWSTSNICNSWSEYVKIIFCMYLETTKLNTKQSKRDRFLVHTQLDFSSACHGSTGVFTIRRYSLNNNTAAAAAASLSVKPSALTFTWNRQLQPSWTRLRSTHRHN